MIKLFLSNLFKAGLDEEEKSLKKVCESSKY